MIAILHEGSAKKTADNELLKLLIKELNLNLELVEFFGMGGKDNFFKIDNTNYKLLLDKIREETISKVFFVLDADYVKDNSKYGGYENSKKGIERVIKELGIENISDFYIVCNPEIGEGYLESFILSTIPKKHRQCIKNFLDCSNFKSKDNDKAILRSIYKVGYPNDPFNFSHPNFDELKSKLIKLFED